MVLAEWSKRQDVVIKLGEAACFVMKGYLGQAKKDYKEHDFWKNEYDKCRGKE